jgi:hypothetical protein
VSLGNCGRLSKEDNTEGANLRATLRVGFFDDSVLGLIDRDSEGRILGRSHGAVDGRSVGATQSFSKKCSASYAS